MILWSMFSLFYAFLCWPLLFSAGLAGEPEMLAKLVDQCNIACFTLAASVQTEHMLITWFCSFSRVI